MKRVWETPKWWRVHNLVAHPLLIVWPRPAVWSHDRTAPTDAKHKPVDTTTR